MITKPSRPLTATLTMSLAAVFFTGCVGYQLGSMLPADIKTVHVPTFVNKTTEPRVEIEATQATIERFQMDGSLRVVEEANADAILLVTLNEYDLKAISYDREKETRANEYRVFLTAELIFKRAKTGEVIAEFPKVAGDTTFVFAGDIAAAKRRALPDAARDLAHDIVERVVEAW